MAEHRRIATSVATRVDLPRDQLGAPGAPGVISVVAEFEDDSRSDFDRLSDSTRRAFVVETLMTKNLSLPEGINGAFTREDGGSLVQVPPGTQHLRLDTTLGTFEIELNAQGEMALIRTQIEADTPLAARNLAQDATSPFLDHLGYLARASVLTGLTKIWDEKNQVTTLDILGPDQPVMLNPGQHEIIGELGPIYALYREFKNSSSAFYRLLCLYKILEGVFLVLRPAANKAVRDLGMTIPLPKEKVPDHTDIPESLRRHIGRPIKAFFDDVLQKEYRNVVAHFLVDKGVPLHTSSAVERHRFAEMAFLCDLCVRIVIANHEKFLRQLETARDSQRP